jgi:hypothetical protein
MKMRKLGIGLLLCVWTGLVLLAFSVEASAEPVLRSLTDDGEFEGWATYQKKDGAKTGNVWSLGDDGVLTCRGQALGYLYTEKSYTNFTLSFEWRWPPSGVAGKGGVLLRTVGEHKIWPKSLEVQLNAGNAGDFWAIDGYKLTATPKRTEKLVHKQFGDLIHVTKLLSVERPVGEWNQGSVTMKDGKVTVCMNGKLVNQAAGCDANPGKIVLTAEGTPIQFRKVDLSESSK